MNYKYGKLAEDGTISFAPRILRIGKKTWVGSIKESVYNQAGYYKIIYADYPEDGKEYVYKYTLVGNVIVQEWVELDLAEEETEEV